MKFKYKAITKEGKTIESQTEAADKFELARQLKARGESLLHMEEIAPRETTIFSYLENMIGGVGLREKIVFMRNLGAMLEAGLPLVRALSVLVKQTDNKNFKKILESVMQDINKGNSFSISLARYPHVFPLLSTSMIRAGEESGKLPESLKIIGDHMEQSYLLKRRIRGALMYPSIVVTAMIVIGVFMMIYIVPILTGVFEELNVELPVTTQFIILLSEFLQEYTLTAILLIVAIIVLLVFFKRSMQGKRMFDRAFLLLPVIGELVRQVNCARTARTLSSLLSSGVSMVQGLTITRDVVQNVYFKDVLKDAEVSIQKGTTLSAVFAKHGSLYPVLLSEMVAVGEETGKLSDMLIRVALFYEGEVEQKTKNMSTIIEPILMIVVGVGVGFFAISMITPLYSVLQGI